MRSTASTLTTTTMPLRATPVAARTSTPKPIATVRRRMGVRRRTGARPASSATSVRVATTGSTAASPTMARTARSSCAPAAGSTTRRSATPGAGPTARPRRAVCRSIPAPASIWVTGRGVPARWRSPGCRPMRWCAARGAPRWRSRPAPTGASRGRRARTPVPAPNRTRAPAGSTACGAATSCRSTRRGSWSRADRGWRSGSRTAMRAASATARAAPCVPTSVQIRATARRMGCTAGRRSAGWSATRS